MSGAADWVGRAGGRGPAGAHEPGVSHAAQVPTLLPLPPSTGGSAELVQNQLLKHTGLATRFSANMVALVGSQPRTLTLKDFLQHFLDFR